ncbi:hypothetical protein CNJ02455 [Cryptococcus deneoformans JEC21]|uniref:Uncharacterized protein n=1 Tax=Cryptococcus deneoformans (strain JEC21 / ATCC MYA-565) TaxID=214684 RepID=A0A0S2LJ80_CRYD1|nr:hypothetical protein CNJ02455 [Cryptococcus neoformans var. neoformans JEC21]ALO60916.1 hypothetical protein CNJ02455 [Cryptococcus neoformans var. neoformans JEC21]
MSHMFTPESDSHNSSGDTRTDHMSSSKTLVSEQESLSFQLSHSHQSASAAFCQSAASSSSAAIRPSDSLSGPSMFNHTPLPINSCSDDSQPLANKRNSSMLTQNPKISKASSWRSFFPNRSPSSLDSPIPTLPTKNTSKESNASKRRKLFLNAPSAPSSIPPPRKIPIKSTISKASLSFLNAPSTPSSIPPPRKIPIKSTISKASLSFLNAPSTPSSIPPPSKIPIKSTISKASLSFLTNKPEAKRPQKQKRQRSSAAPSGNTSALVAKCLPKETSEKMPFLKPSTRQRPGRYDPHVEKQHGTHAEERSTKTPQTGSHAHASASSPSSNSNLSSFAPPSSTSH